MIDAAMSKTTIRRGTIVSSLFDFLERLLRFSDFLQQEPGRGSVRAPIPRNAALAVAEKPDENEPEAVPSQSVRWLQTTPFPREGEKGPPEVKPRQVQV